jgi:hypothetical protein
MNSPEDWKNNIELKKTGWQNKKILLWKVKRIDSCTGGSVRQLFGNKISWYWL